jgi:hypothetical protein
MRRSFLCALGAALLSPLAAAAAQQPAASAPRPGLHPLPIVGATRERFDAVDAVTIGDRIFVVERNDAGGWLRVFDASDVANPFEIRDAMMPVAGRPLAIGGAGSRVLVASVTSDTTRLRLTLFDVGHADRSRWSGAASLRLDVPAAGVEELYVEGDRAAVHVSYGPLLEVDLGQHERDFSAATGSDESSSGAHRLSRALTGRGSIIGDDALVPLSVDTAYRAGVPELYSGWDFAQRNQFRSRLARTGTLVRIHGQWDLDLLDAATRRIEFTTHVDGKNVNSLTAPDSAEILVNDLVRVDTLGGRQLAVFNATILGPTHREKAWEGGAVVDITDARAPLVIGVDRQLSIDTSSLGYGWRSYVRQALFARGAIVEVGYESTRIVRFDGTRMNGVDVTGRFAGRLVGGPDGTVLELSVEAPWRDLRRVPRADSTAPAVRIRTTTPRLAVREAATAIPVDDRGRATTSHRVRVELVTPRSLEEPRDVVIAATERVSLPVTRRGPLLEARLPAGTPLGMGALTLRLSAAGASGEWIALAAPSATLRPGATRAFVALDDPLTAGAIVIADSGGNPATDAAFTDRRLRARLQRDSMATIFVVPALDGSTARVIRRDRGRADIAASRSSMIASYPAPGATASLAALRHLGRSPSMQLAFCLRDAIGKRVKQEYNTYNEELVSYPPCGAAAPIREWVGRRGAAIVEGDDAAVLITRRFLPPFGRFVERYRYSYWTRARLEIVADTATTWEAWRTVAREDSATAIDAPAVLTLLPAAQRNTVASVVAQVALLDPVGTVYTDSTDSSMAVIRGTVTPLLVADDTVRQGVLALTETGDVVYGDWTEGRFVPRWEGRSYSSAATPELVDLDGDGLGEFAFATFDHDAKGHVVSQEFWAYDRFGRELTRQQASIADSAEALPISAEIVDSEYCEGDCGGLTIGTPGADGTRPILTSEGTWVLRDGRYVLRPTPPKPAPRRKSTSKAASKRGIAKKPPPKKATP